MQRLQYWRDLMAGYHEKILLQKIKYNGNLDLFLHTTDSQFYLWQFTPRVLVKISVERLTALWRYINFVLLWLLLFYIIIIGDA